MNLLYRYIFTIKDYFLSKKFFIFSFVSTFFIYFFHFFIDYFCNSEKFNFIYWKFMEPCFIYISMVLVMYMYTKNNLLKKKDLSLSYKNLLSLFIVFFLKCFWNILEIIFLETDLIQNTENSDISFLIFLGIFWIVVYYIASYFVPYIIFNNSEKKKSSFFQYIRQNFFNLLTYLIFSFIFSFVLIFIMSFLLSKIELLFSIFNSYYIHLFLEDTLSIYFGIVFSHIVSIYLLRFYFYQNIRKRKIY